MTGRDVFNIWTPTDTRWTDWVRPVHFVTIDNTLPLRDLYDGTLRAAYPTIRFTIPNIFYLNELKQDTAIILDLPSYTAVPESLAIARMGYRPIPLYNGTNAQPEAVAIIDNHTIEAWFMNSVSINENEKTTTFSIIPNPATNYIEISLTDLGLLSGEITAQIFDIRGVLLQTIKIYDEKTLVDISNLSEGLYFVQIGNYAKKIIIK